MGIADLGIVWWKSLVDPATNDEHFRSRPYERVKTSPLKDNQKSPCGAVISMNLTTPRIVMSRFLRLLSLADNPSVVANWAFPDSSGRVLARLRAAQYYLQAMTARFRSYFQAIAVAVMCLVPQMFAQVYCRV